jgi:hypothetical protein
MTYLQKHEELLNKANDTWNNLLAVDKRRSGTNGSGDIDDLPEYNKAYKDWQYDADNYTGFVSWLRGKGLDLNSEIPN